MKVTKPEQLLIAKAFSAAEVHDDIRYGWKWNCRLCKDYIYMSRSRSSTITIAERTALSNHFKSAAHEQEQMLKQLSNEAGGGDIELLPTR